MTLVSTMVAIMLLGTGAMALAAANASSLRARNGAATRGTALTLARAHVETLRAVDPFTLASESSIAIDENGVPTNGGAYRRSITVTEVRTNLIRLDVTVTGPGVPTPVTVSTNIYRGGALHRQ
jgi:Tfp pilus assembly protein PilV